MSQTGGRCGCGGEREPMQEYKKLISLPLSVMRKLRTLFSPHFGLVYFQCDLSKPLPPLPVITPFYIKEMDVKNEFQINEWLSIMNQAFKTNSSRTDFEKIILTHPYYEVAHTYFLMDGDECIGAVSEAHYRSNKKIGVTHMLGINQEYRGKNLGKYMILYVLHQLKEHGYSYCEGESRLRHKKSLHIHFDFGFYPKKKADYWNTKDNASFINQAMSKLFFMLEYKKWRRKGALP
jgi:GNAT superfamily N-acetyltransferase